MIGRFLKDCTCYLLHIEKEIVFKIDLFFLVNKFNDDDELFLHIGWPPILN